MALFGRPLRWLAATDPNLDADQRLQRWVNVAAAVGVVVSLGGGAVGWVFDYPWVGVVVGLGLWVVILNMFVAISRRSRPAAPPDSSVELQPESTTSQHPTLRQTVDWRPLWFGIPTAEDARKRLIEENAQSASPDPLIKVLIENDRVRIERDEARTEIKGLRAENKRLSAQIQQLDEDLKQRCRKLVAELSEFVDERAREHPQKKTWRPNLGEVIPYNNETVEEYDRRFGREVAILLDILERRGCWSDPKERKKFENPRVGLSIRNLRALVQRLAVLCERL